MRKLFISIFLWMFCLTGVSYARPSLDNSIPVKEITESVIISKRVQKSTVSIFSLGGSIGFCTGVIVVETDTHTGILTCKHCVSASEETLVENIPASSIIASMDEDLAFIIMKGKIPKKTSAVLANKNPELNDELIHIGYPIFKLWESWGKLIRTSKDWHWADFVSKGGCSGGGVYNKRSELVGIL